MIQAINQFGVALDFSSIYEIVLSYSIFLAIAFISHFIAQKFLIKIIRGLIQKSKAQWQDYFAQNKVLEMSMRLVPVLIFQNLATTLSWQPELLFRALEIITVLIVVLAMFRVFDSVRDLFEGPLLDVQRPIRGYIQLMKILLGAITVIVIVSVAMGKSPMLLLSGLGALSAVLMLVFKDTVTSFVASLQITAFDILKVGDWLEVPSLEVDGDVTDISLYQIRVQNWDKSISVVPLHKLFETNFRNWRGMLNSGGRRIKRSILIDVSSVKFLNDAELERLSKVHSLKDYIEVKIAEVRADNEARAESGIDMGEPMNTRRLTNIGTFRNYAVCYLKKHPKIHQDMTFIVRQLANEGSGVPIEICVFSKETVWVNYESIQSDIFDHLIAVAGAFDLKLI